MEYNTSLPKMIIPEYGRNIQKMIDFAMTVKDREERNKVARAIIDVMGQLKPGHRAASEHKPAGRCAAGRATARGRGPPKA